MNHSLVNPYYNTASIDDHNLFFNRRREVDEALNLLLSSIPQCIAVVGQRKIGKSSFAKHISRKSTLENYNYQSDKYIFVLFDCQKNAHTLKDAHSLYEGIVESIKDVIPEPLVVRSSPTGNSGYTGEQLEEICRTLRLEGLTIIIIFDEFEKAIAQEKLITEGFFGSLRGYTQANQNFAWVTCTSRPLYVLFEESFNEYQIPAAKRKSESDFFNISTPLELNLFTETDVLELITQPAKAQGIQFTDSTIEDISFFGGRFPFFIQRACYHFFNAYESGDFDGKTVLNRCLRGALQVWESFWSKLEDGERALILSIAKGDALNFSKIEITRLQEQSLCYFDRDQHLKLFSEAFKEFLLSKSEEAQYYGLAQQNELLTSENESLKVDLAEAKKHYEESRKTLELSQTAITQIRAENTSVKASLTDTEAKVENLDKKLFRQVESNKNLQKDVQRRSLYVRILIALILTIFGLQVLFLHSYFNALSSLDTHPKKINIYIFACLIIGGLDWAIIDSKNWRLALLTIFIAAIIGMAQIL